MAEKVSRRKFLKMAIGAGVGAAAIGIGAATFLPRGQQGPTPTDEASPSSPSSGGGKYGGVGRPVNLNIGYLPYASDIITADLIKQAHLLEKYLPQGSTVTWLKFLGGVLVTNNMLADKVQIGYMGDAPSYRCLDILDSKVISLGSYEEGLTGDAAMKKFGEPKSLLQSLVVRPEVADKYKTVEDLEGATIGVPLGSIGHKQAITIEKDGWETDGVSTAIEQANEGDSIAYPSANKIVEGLIEHSGKKKGIKYGRILDLNTELQMAQLRAGTIDIVSTWEPYVLWMEQKGIGKRFITSTDTLCQCRTGTHFHVSSPILARNDFIQGRPDVVEAFLQAEEDAKEMITKDPDSAAEIIWGDITDVPIEIIQKDLRMMVYDGRIHPEMMEHHKRSAKIWQELGIYRGERTGWEPERIVEYGYDSSFLDNVIAKRKKAGKWTSEDLGRLRNW